MSFLLNGWGFGGGSYDSQSGWPSSSCRHDRFPEISVLQIQIWASSWEQSINIVIVVLGPSVLFMSLILSILIAWKLCNHFLKVAVIIFAYLGFGNKDNQTRILPWQTPVAMWFKASLSHATGTFAAAAWFLSLFPINRSDLSLKFASSPGHLFGGNQIHFTYFESQLNEASWETQTIYLLFIHSVLLVSPQFLTVAWLHEHLNSENHTRKRWNWGSDDIVLGKQKLQVEHSLERKKNEASEKLGLSERVVAPLYYASDFSVNGP